MFTRYYDDKILAKLAIGKVLVIYGPRRVGKTTLITNFLKTYKGKYYSGIGEDIILRDILESHNIQQIKNTFSNYDLIVIDEAQHIHSIGAALKIIVDNIPDIRVIASGSSSFELSNKLGEPLTGRQRILTMYPMASLELINCFGEMKFIEMLEELLIYGSYPEVLTEKNVNEKIDYLTTLRNSYLFKDILELENIRNSSKLSDLLRLLAFQLGKEVSLNELAASLGIAKQTVGRYLDLLEKTFIIKKVRGFSRNLRKEITKTSRYYFWDNGVRNALINNFNSLRNRDDIGLLWENFLFIERLKKQSYLNIQANNYFWRTYDGKEVDLVEEREGKLFGYEFKWSPLKIKEPRLWRETYSEAEYETITRENFLAFIN